MSLRQNFATDQAAEREGVWVTLGFNADKSPIRFKLSRMGKSNQRYTKALETATRDHRVAIDNESMDLILADEILQAVFVDTILLEWDGVRAHELAETPDEEDTTPLPFNRENALALFKAMPGTYDALEDRAKKAATFRGNARDKAAKN